MAKKVAYIDIDELLWFGDSLKIKWWGNWLTCFLNYVERIRKWSSVGKLESQVPILTLPCDLRIQSSPLIAPRVSTVQELLTFSSACNLYWRHSSATRFVSDFDETMQSWANLSFLNERPSAMALAAILEQSYDAKSGAHMWRFFFSSCG